MVAKSNYFTPAEQYLARIDESITELCQHNPQIGKRLSIQMSIPAQVDQLCRILKEYDEEVRVSQDRENEAHLACAAIVLENAWSDAQRDIREV